MCAHLSTFLYYCRSWWKKWVYFFPLWFIPLILIADKMIFLKWFSSLFLTMYINARNWSHYAGANITNVVVWIISKLYKIEFLSWASNEYYSYNRTVEPPKDSHRFFFVIMCLCAHFFPFFGVIIALFLFVLVCAWHHTQKEKRFERRDISVEQVVT